MLIKERFGAFTVQNAQNAFALLFKLKSDGIETVDDAMLKLEQYVEEQAYKRKKKENQRKYKRERASIPDHVCSVCGGPVYLEPVNISDSTRTEDNSKTAIMCYNAKTCGHTEYSEIEGKDFPMKWVMIKYDRMKRVRIFDAS